MFSLLKSTFTTCIVSTLLALILMPFTHSFWTVFLVTTIAQFVIFYIVGSVIDFLSEIKFKQIQALTLSEYSKQGIEVECPCYKKVKEFVPVVLNQENSYKCGTCGKNNSIIITAETAAVTEPIPLTPLVLDTKNG